MATAFFNPTDPFGLTGWEAQTKNPNATNQRAQALGADGDEIDSKLYDGREAITASYVATDDDATIPAAGAVMGGYHIDNVQIQFTNTDFVRMTVQAHKHNGSSHASGTGAPRTYKSSFTNQKIPGKFGCPASLLGLSIPQNAGVRTFTYTLSVNHVDELDSDGDWLAGDNYDGTETVEAELCETGTVSADTGWDLTANGKSFGNTTAQTATATAVHHLAHYVASGS